MEKTKLGISVGLMGMILYFSAFFGGYIPVILITGYILLAEEDAWLKNAAVKAVILKIAFSLIPTVLGLIPGSIGLIDSLLGIFGGHFSISFINNLIYFINDVVDMVETLIFLILGLVALNKGSVQLPVVDDTIKKHSN